MAGALCNVWLQFSRLTHFALTGYVQGPQKWVTLASMEKQTTKALTEEMANYLNERNPLLKTGICNVHRSQDYARLSSLAYKLNNDNLSSKEEKLLMASLKIDACYTFLREYSSRDHVMFKNNAGLVVIAFRGTELRKIFSNGDIWADLDIALGDVEHSERFINATKVAKEAIKYFGKKNIHVTGHSLGGSQALHVSKKFNLRAYVFNPGFGLVKDFRGKLKRLAPKFVKAYHGSKWSLFGFLKKWAKGQKGKSKIFVTGLDPISVNAFLHDDWDQFHVITLSNWEGGINVHSLDNFIYLNGATSGHKYLDALEFTITKAYDSLAYAVIHRVKARGNKLDIYVTTHSTKSPAFGWKKMKEDAMVAFAHDVDDEQSALFKWTQRVGLEPNLTVVALNQESSWLWLFFLPWRAIVAVVCAIVAAVCAIVVLIWQAFVAVVCAIVVLIWQVFVVAVVLCVCVCVVCGLLKVSDSSSKKK